MFVCVFLFLCLLVSAMISIVVVSVVIFGALYLVTLPAASQDILLSIGFSIAAVSSMTFLFFPKYLKISDRSQQTRRVDFVESTPSSKADIPPNNIKRKYSFRLQQVISPVENVSVDEISPLNFASMNDLRKMQPLEKKRVAMEQTALWSHFLQQMNLNGDFGSNDPADPNSFVVVGQVYELPSAPAEHEDNVEDMNADRTVSASRKQGFRDFRFERT